MSLQTRGVKVVNVSASFEDIFSKHGTDRQRKKNIMSLARFQQCWGIKLKKKAAKREEYWSLRLHIPMFVFIYVFMAHEGHKPPGDGSPSRCLPCGSIINWKRRSGLFWFCLGGIWHKHFHTGSIRGERDPSYFASPNATVTLIWKSHVRGIWSRN